jgi:hypothetical protein
MIDMDQCYLIVLLIALGKFLVPSSLAIGKATRPIPEKLEVVLIKLEIGLKNPTLNLISKQGIV